MAKFRHSEKDFSSNMLPKNRKEVFFDVLKLHYWKLLACGLIMLAAALPLHVYATVSDVYELTLQSQFVQGNITAIQLKSYWLSFGNIRGVVEIAFCAVFFVTLGAVLRVIRQLAWEENVFMRYDLVKGLKQNTAQCFFVGIIFGVIRFACKFFMNYLVADNGIPYLGAILTVLSVLILAPACMYTLVCIAVYGNKFRHNVRLGFMLYFKHPLKTLGAYLACVVLFVPQFIPMFGFAFIYVHVIFRIVSSLLSGIILLAWFLFASHVLDKDVNAKHYPELIDRGVLGKPRKHLADEKETLS